MADDIGICRDPGCPNQGRPGEDGWCDDSHFEIPDGPFRDRKLWVLTEKCSTCIFRPGNKMHLNPGRVEAMVEGCISENTVIPCHQTLDGPRSVCRGLWDTHRGDIGVLRLAQAMGVIEFDEPPAEH